VGGTNAAQILTLRCLSGVANTCYYGCMNNVSEELLYPGFVP